MICRLDGFAGAVCKGKHLPCLLLTTEDTDKSCKSHPHLPALSVVSSVAGHGGGVLWGWRSGITISQGSCDVLGNGEPPV